MVYFLRVSVWGENSPEYSYTLALKALIDNIKGRYLGCKIPYALAKMNSSNWKDNFASTVTQKNQK